MNFLRRNSGFSLIELIIVVIILSILATIAIPLFMHSSEQSYANLAVANLKAARVAERLNLTQSITGTFASLPVLAGHKDPGNGTCGDVDPSLTQFLDPAIACPPSGSNPPYTYAATSTGSNTYTITATRSSGGWTISIDDTGLISKGPSPPFPTYIQLPTY